ncbi:protein draper-like isoform X1 [Haliotis rufescens]|uniref:protein draper-like isoform X1 n=1 Tax=Haliotis rufescens TaxID=6454 RepID=UPI00201F9B60|nr:protein draper-like isoform X1 [Haliotis rufescens]
MKVCIVLFVSACILMEAESGLAKDNSKCQDALALCKGVNCDNPGMADTCPVTCGRCNPTDCGPGMYWNGTTCAQCLDGLPAENKGSCPCTITGRWGSKCEHQCNKGCSGGTCHPLSGECENCTRDRYSKFCNDICAANCNNCTDTSSNCHRTTGTCLCGCRPGLYGGTCEQRCHANCRFKTCNSSGICVDGCKEGYFGPKCDKNCGECVNQSCSRIGTCLKGCNSGWHGLKCNTPCSYNCEHSNCQQNGTCMACLGGFHGDSCNKNCSAGCATRQCNRDGSCQCKKTNFGQQCLNTCSVTCLNTSCSQTSGECDYGCVSGWYGATCSATCPDNCSAGTCNRDGGSCLSCREGFRGTHCNMSCPPHCVECQQNASHCTSCEPGYFGNTCVKECDGCLDGRCNITDGLCIAGCKPSLYGRECQYNCSRNCLRQNGASLCFQSNGTCVYGCNTGWYKAECDTPCPPGCSGTTCDDFTGRCSNGCTDALYGPHCNQSCRCLMSRCNAAGLCTGCQNGYYGQSCSTTCPSRCDTCEQNTGDCVTCVEGWHGHLCKVSYVQSLRHRVRVLSTCIGVFLFGVGIVVAFIIIRKKCTRSPRGIYLSPVRTDHLDSDDISLQEFSEDGESGQSHYETIPDDSLGGYEALTPSTSRTSGYTALPPSLDNVRVTGV